MTTRPSWPPQPSVRVLGEEFQLQKARWAEGPARVSREPCVAGPRSSFGLSLHGSARLVGTMVTEVRFKEHHGNAGHLLRGPQGSAGLTLTRQEESMDSFLEVTAQCVLLTRSLQLFI